MGSLNNSPPETSEGGERNTVPVEIRLASWIDRFVAWLVDFIIVSISLGFVFALIAFPYWVFHYGNATMMWYRNIGPSHYLLSSFIFFAYWTFFESTSGQSIGKKLLNIETTDLAGKRIDIKSAAIESFGKSFLLPIDVILGWIFTNNKRQRTFNKISKTIVIKLRPREELSADNIRYIKD